MARQGDTYKQRVFSKSEQFWQKVDKSGGKNACWIWTGYARRYGYFGVGSRKNKSRRNVLAHRFSYEEARGPIPVGVEIDHLCRNHLCVNPKHLEAVTHQENMSRGHWGQKTHCPQGHPYDGVNSVTYVRKDGIRNRICLICRRDEHRLKYNNDPSYREKMAERSRKSYQKRKAKTG